MDLSFQEMRPSVYHADYYPFGPAESTGSRRTYASSFIYIRSGYGRMRVGRAEYVLKPGQMIYLRSGVSHRFEASREDPMIHASIYFDWLTYPDPKPSGNRHLFCFEPASFIEGNCKESIASIEGIAIPLIQELPSHFEGISYFERVIDRMEDSETGLKLELRSNFELFAVSLLRYIDSPYKLTDRRIRRIVERMETAAALGRLSVDDWAAEIGISAAYFHELFRKQTGMSPQKFHQACLLNRGKRLLRESNASVTEISEALGFSSIHYFTRSFTSRFGESPTKYRSRLRNYNQISLP